MKKPLLPKTSVSKSSKVSSNSPKRRNRRSNKNSDVLISAVVSSYLLTHLHHVLQKAEYGATSEGRVSHASNFAQLRKVLCLDARSMEDASALGLKEGDLDHFKDVNVQQKVA